MKSKAGKYIELFGVAGVGKTTASKILIKEVRKSGVSISNRDVVGKNPWFRLRIIYTIIALLISVPEILSLYFVSARKAYKKTPHIRKTMRNLVTRMIIDTAVIRCLMVQSSKSIVNDEGLIGKLVSLTVLTEIAPIKMYTLLEKLLPKPVVLVHVMSSPLIALEREHSRNIKIPFFNDMAYDLKENFFYEAVSIYKSLPTAVISMSNFEATSIDNTGTYDDLIKEVISVAKRICLII